MVMKKGRWWEDEDKLEDIGFVEKMRRGGKKGKSSKNALLDDSFIIDRDDLPKFLKENSEFFVARVVEVHKKFCFLSPDNLKGKIDTRDVWLGTIAKRYLQAERMERNFIAVGDVVVCRPDSVDVPNASSDLPQCVVEFLVKRTNQIARRDPLNPEVTHVLASNLDQLVIVASILDPKVKWGLIDRYLTLAEAERMPAVIILTKKDLIADPSMSAVREETDKFIKIYKDLGYKVLCIQSNLKAEDDPKQTKDLQNVFKGKISLISGHSGVGKSSIANLLEPEIEQDVEDQEIFYKGRHTTSYASLIKFGRGGFVVDTPGIRSFCIDERSASELQYCFRELRPLIGQCKYRECRHINEPMCAVKQALENSQISEWRYRSFLGILLGATGREGRIRDIDIDLEEN
jgi:ribosome biogenesis GTPase